MESLSEELRDFSTLHADLKMVGDVYLCCDLVFLFLRHSNKLATANEQLILSFLCRNVINSFK